ncbi:unnamed protein product [Clonostachys rosea f. rosea IK726]|uniref:Uncharacterized protein n=2 Tax=Bionectria ochroleuca TaxID=29856 RepID=A0A0B7KPK9_BIOOC|nr:unnamed protein product [Clonostachys rosea f. rosea IK726]
MKFSITLSIVSLGLLVAGQQGETIHCGGRLPSCPLDYKCVPDSPKCTDTRSCAGHCEFIRKYSDCGGNRITPKNCPSGSRCYPDPRVPGADSNMPGICIPNNQPQCHGFIGLSCPSGLTCYDVPEDGCDPQNGGADCIGVCL